MKLKHSYIKEYKELIFYIIIGIISYIIDFYTGKNKLYNNCKKPTYTLLILFLHHIYVSFLNFGWISNNENILILHVILMLVEIVSVINNNNICPLTDIVNINCNIKRGSSFRDYLYFAKIKKYNLYVYYRICCFMISIIKLYNLKN